MLDRRQELLYYRECDSVANNIIGRKACLCAALRPPQTATMLPSLSLSLSSRLAAREDAVKPDGRTELPRASRMVAFHSVQRDHQEGEIDRAACRRLT